VKAQDLPAAAAGPAGASAEGDNGRHESASTGRAPVLWFGIRMRIKNPEAKDKLIQRLRRVEGQIRGVESMLDEERDCQEILQQLSAIRSAVQSASRIFLQEYATACLVEIDEDHLPEGRQEVRTRREKIVQDMIALLDKAP